MLRESMKNRLDSRQVSRIRDGVAYFASHCMNLRSPLPVIFAAAFVAVTLTAAPIERDLGSGLAYVRVHELPVDLPPNPTGRVPPTVLDLRYARGDADAATAFVAWLKFRATPRTPVFVLANSETSPALLKILAPHQATNGIMLVGIPSGRFHPDIEVKTSAD